MRPIQHLPFDHTLTKQLNHCELLYLFQFIFFCFISFSFQSRRFLIKKQIEIHPHLNNKWAHNYAGLMDQFKKFKANFCKNRKFKVCYFRICKDFLLRYQLIGQKFKLLTKFIPSPQFQSIIKNENSILFKSSFNPTNNNQADNARFYGILFEQADQDDHKSKHYNALFYQGQFLQFQIKEGIGYAIFDNGDTYEGEWKNNSIDGNGTYTRHENKTIYEGEFKGWKKQGKGKLFSNIDKKFTYQGQFKNNEIHGNGTIQYEDQSKYEGQFKNGHQEGSGIYKTKNMKYEGTFKKGLMSGAGTAIWYSDKGQITSKYTGQYLEGKKHGFGQYEVKNGKLLRGQWFEGRFNPGANSYVL